VADLVLGPLLRYVNEDSAVFWVEADGPCEVTVLDHTDRTFHVEGHHFALVRVEGLEPGKVHEYDVRLDGRRVWPEEGTDLPSAFRTLGGENEDLYILFGSCRVAVPNEPPYNLKKDQDDRGREHDALRTLALRLRDEPREDLPELLLLLGDQVYADEVSPRTLEFIKSRRDTSEPPGEIALGFEEYTRLYRESWGEPVIRWLLSCVSTAMIFDDHDVHDDWNASDVWLEEMRATDWWEEHIVGALMSYWLYQHIGNLSPDEQDRDGLLAEIKEADDGGPLLREFALGADRERGNSRWSYHRDLGSTRLLMVDSRAGRVLEPENRDMLDEAEWEWIEEHARGEFDHLLIATSLPWLLAPGMHHLEAWNEAVCAGAWGRAAAKVGEKLRQGVDLEHWAAFNRGFERLAGVQRAAGSGESGEPPATIVTLSGDVHHAYLTEVAFRREDGVKSNVYQAVCSPMRNPLDARERRTIRFMGNRVAHALCRALARAAGVRDPSVRWRSVADDPWFDNQVASLRLDGRRADFALEKALPDGNGGARLECIFEHRLS
jgi:PhoD-like phosphatase